MRPGGRAASWGSPSLPRRDLVCRLVVFGVLSLCLSACGQKGPPLPPLHLVPAAPAEFSVRRVGDQVRVRLVLPAANANGPGPVQLDQVEIYAVTVPPGATPTNRLLLAKERVVGRIAVRPPTPEGEEPKPEDPRPAPGTPVVFDEPLTPAKLQPIEDQSLQPAARSAPGAGTGAKPVPDADTAKPTGEAGAAAKPTPGAEAGAKPTPDAGTAAKPAGEPGAAAKPPTEAETAVKPPTDAGTAAKPPGETGTAAVSGATAAGKPTPQDAAAGKPVQGEAAAAAAKPVAAAAKPAAPVSKDPVRVYVARGLTRSGRPGAPSARKSIPVVPPPPAPVDLTSRVTETAIVLEWKRPADVAQPLMFSVYRGEEIVNPINPAPLDKPAFEYSGMKFGEEYCFQVRSVIATAGSSIEGEPSAPECVTPKDTFPPAAPKQPDAVATEGQINLIWDPNTEKDLAGYLVLRGEGPDGALQPITPAPIRESSYRDTTVQPGVRYSYAIMAVDSATPPNSSPQSPRVEETAR